MIASIEVNYQHRLDVTVDLMAVAPE